MKRTLLAALLATACTSAEVDPANPFLAEEENSGKADTQYINPDGVEVEVDLEGDAEASWSLREAPAALGQFALTYLRKRGEFYLESLAEDASSSSRVEWLVDGTWLTAAEAQGIAESKLRHFRVRGVNAVLLHSASRGVGVGTVFTATTPINPGNVMSLAGDKCADPDGHMDLSQSVYWYLWNPEREGCTAAVPTQDLKVTVSKMFQGQATVFPEYDKLIADGKVTAVVLFGLIGDEMDESDTGFRGLARMARWLTEASFTEVTPAPVGRRFTKHIGEVDFEIDLYSPREFSGLSDMANWSNFQTALGTHEIVVYDGHSMLGASDFWERPTYAPGYQIFLYGGCLGYEYYVRPILEKKGGWENLDIMSSVVEVSAGANEFAGPALAKIAYTLDHGMSASWQDILIAVRKGVGDSTFGVSGVRENCYTPAGSRCGGENPRPAEEQRFESSGAVSIPDDDPTGATSTIKIDQPLTPTTLELALDVSHTYVGDLSITVSHDGVEETVWNLEGGSADSISTTVTLTKFSGSVEGLWTLRVIDTAAQDSGTLNSWTLIAR